MEGEEEDSKVGLVVEQVHLPPIANKKPLKKGSSGEGSQDESEEGRAKSLEKKKDWHLPQTKGAKKGSTSDDIMQPKKKTDKSGDVHDFIRFAKQNAESKMFV